MERHDRLATKKLDASKESLKSRKSDPMPAWEVARCHFKGGEVKLNGIQYPRCSNQNCKHTLIDGPPDNVTRIQSNKDAIQS